MKVHLAGEHEVKNGSVCQSWEGLNILESFYYARQNKHVERLIRNVGHLLLDSGAFTFLVGKQSGAVDWDAYVEEFANYINKHNVQHFFELDIDAIVGLQEVERLRTKLQQLTNKQPIPVWHRNRGKDYYIRMCQEYPYVALGGIAIKEIPINKFEPMFPWFIKTAHKYGAMIHGLGYTRQQGMHKYHFDSVDSTAWLYGNRGGYIYKFNPTTGFVDKMEGTGRLLARAGAQNNFNEWIKFCKYAEHNL
jgi:hypothetical protein